jgi:archaeosine synthase beta-subunit
MQDNLLKQEVKNSLLDLKRNIRDLMPQLKELIDIKRVSTSEIKEGMLDNKPIKRVIIILRSVGCSWSLNDHGGCAMCGHSLGTLRGDKISAELYCQQFDHEMSLYDFTNFPMLCLYNSGSFLNPNEIPKEAQHYMLDKINNTPGIKKLIIESRPEFITSEVLDEVESICTNIEIEIGVGLESYNEEIRDLCLNKGLSNNDFNEVGARIRGHKTKLLAYVLIKSPFLTEKEAIDDAINTVKFAFNIGFEVVSLEPVSVQDFTLTSYLYEAGYFRTPWIWSVIEIVKATHMLGFVRIGGFEFFPVPKIFTHNCHLCNEKMIRAIQQFNSNYNISVFNDLNCKCKNDWEFDLSEVQPSLSERIRKILSLIDKEEVFRRMRMSFDTRGDLSKIINRVIFSSCSKYNICN